MFVMLLGSIANAQTFDFGCEPVLTAFESELNDFYSADAPPTGFISGSVVDAQAQSAADGIARNTFAKRVASSNHRLGEQISDASGLATADIHKKSNSQKVGSVSADSGTIAFMSGPEFSNFVLKIITKIWNIEHPNYAGPTVQSDLSAIYAAGYYSNCTYRSY